MLYFIIGFIIGVIAGILWIAAGLISCSDEKLKQFLITLKERRNKNVK